MLLDNNEPTSYGEAMTLEELLDGRKAVRYIWILEGRRTMM
ncbi:hypothetical protein T12_16662, partial [Trichinella patagoniensis]